MDYRGQNLNASSGFSSIKVVQLKFTILYVTELDKERAETRSNLVSGYL
jgi:hypothetical protein